MSRAIEISAARKKEPGIKPDDIGNRKTLLRLRLTGRGATIVTDNIVLGSRDDSQNMDELEKLGISHILNVAAQLPNTFDGYFEYKKLDLLDNKECNVMSVMPEAIEFIKRIENNNGRVLIHCISGISRSVTVLIMYLMMEHKLRLKNVYDYIKQIRPFIAPNESFKLQLAHCEIDVFGFSSVTGTGYQEWNFYAWNKEKQKYKATSSQESRSTSVACSVM